MLTVDVLTVTLWYWCSYAVLWTLKFSINDTNCSRYPNSVSGHFNFFISLLLVIVHIWNRHEHALRIGQRSRG